MSQPDMQRVTVVGLRGQPEDAAARLEAYEIRVGPGGGLPGEEALDRALAAIAPRYYVLSESRRQTNWGATGLQTQDIEILYAITVGAQVTAAALIGAFAAARQRVLDSHKVADADAAWTLFNEFLLRAFKVPEAKLIDAVKDGDAWRLIAEAHGRRYEGHVGGDGGILEARKLGSPAS